MNVDEKKEQILHDLKRLAIDFDKLYADVAELLNGKEEDNGHSGNSRQSS